MKAVTLFIGLICLATAVLGAKPVNVPAAAPSAVSAVGLPLATIAPPPTLTQDLEELSRFVPMKMIMKLVTRYLLNDAEFQAVVRSINSYDAFIVRMRLRSQPEIMMFQSWVRSQLMLSGGSMEMDESLEVKLFKMSPYWANTVYGWQGFINELMSYYPQELLRAHIDMKVAQGGIFAQFWARLKALKPVYERILAFPETQRLITHLQTNGVDTNQLDLFIRTQFDWLNLPIAPAGIAGPATANISPVGGQPARAAAPVLG